MRRSLLFIVVLFLAGCGGSTASEPTAAPPTATAAPTPTVARPTATVALAPETYTVEYVLRSVPKANVSITYENGNGGTSQESGVITPWSKTVTMQAGDFAYISAQNNEYASEIACDILIDGVSAAFSQSSGTFVIATCEATVGD